MDIEVQLGRENCEGCATSCRLSAPSCPFGQAAARDRREELDGGSGEGDAEGAPLID